MGVEEGKGALNQKIGGRGMAIFGNKRILGPLPISNYSPKISLV